jgi:hypothetical protein
MKYCTKEEIAREKQKFESDGVEYIPSPPAMLIAISLIEGDTIIMPPGTIHVPVTATDRFFRGFIGVHPRYVSRSIDTWDWLVRNEDCTNEEAPRETRRII